MDKPYDQELERDWDETEEFVVNYPTMPALPEQDWDTFVCLLDRQGPFNVRLDRLLTNIPGVRA